MNSKDQSRQFLMIRRKPIGSHTIKLFEQHLEIESSLRA
jgi:2-C-methyl-D-erythritol 4-phosphate cytidylyltransferase